MFQRCDQKSWKDDNGDWKEKTQWHDVRAFGNAFSKIAERLVKGCLVYVQGELVTREYDRTIKVPNGKKTIEHTIKRLVVELKADTIRILDRSKSNATRRPPSETRPPNRGLTCQTPILTPKVASDALPTRNREPFHYLPLFFNSEWS